MGGKDARRRAAKQKRRASRKSNASKRKAARPAPSGYHAERALDAHAWQALSPDERLEQVEAYHQRLPGGRPPPDPRRHAALHVLVEDQLAAEDPPEVLSALGRLVQDGMTRHEALHAVGFIATQVMQRAVETRSAPDFEGYAQQLRGLDRAGFEAIVQRSLA